MIVTKTYKDYITYKILIKNSNNKNNYIEVYTIIPEKYYFYKQLGNVSYSYSDKQIKEYTKETHQNARDVIKDLFI